MSGFDFTIDMDNLNPAVWFGDTPGKRVCLRLCSPEKVEEFREECTTTKKTAVLNTQTKRMEIVEDCPFDKKKFSQLLHCYSIADWDLDDVNGNPIPCTDENKLKLMEVPKFVQFINECIEELAEQAGIRKKDEIKNFESSLGG
ncbi:MAG: hypothetical protein A4E65_02315 [Syntrophorhabdus sp. PtaU1.Bin153]|nr:MAG: hypothetical protein A4E65_02315 [Syntrophorhabdus sp. PtaU1.Bin153]